MKKQVSFKGKIVLTVGIIAAIGIGINCWIVSSRTNLPGGDWYKEYAIENNLPHGLNVSFTGMEDKAGGNTVFWSEDMAESFRQWRKEYAPYASVVEPPDYSSTAFTNYDSYLKEAIEESKYVEEWLDKRMTNTVDSGISLQKAKIEIYEGMSVEDYKLVCYGYILNNYTYDKTIKDHNLAKTVIDSGRGACNGLSALYRDMINWADFDENWNLTFDKEKAVNKLDMLIIGGNGHAWNVMQDWDGTWRYFDVTYDKNSTNTTITKESANKLKLYNRTEEEFYTYASEEDIPKVQLKSGEIVNWERPKVALREGWHVYLAGYNEKFADGAAFM